jgi:hypothetical protein
MPFLLSWLRRLGADSEVVCAVGASGGVVLAGPSWGAMGVALVREFGVFMVFCESEGRVRGLLAGAVPFARADDGLTSLSSSHCRFNAEPMVGRRVGMVSVRVMVRWEEVKMEGRGKIADGRKWVGLGQGRVFDPSTFGLGFQQVRRKACGLF